MPFTALKGLSVPTAGSLSGVWGAGSSESLNDGVFEPLDTMLAGIQPFSVDSSNVTLSAANVQQCALRFTGTLLANIVVSPGGGVLFNGFYYWENLTSGSFSITVTTGAGSVVLPQGRRGVLFVDDTNGPRIFAITGTSGADPIPTGTVMVFYQNAAPAGWTIDSSLNDYALKIVSSAGGVTTGTVAYSTLFGRTATDSHFLTTAQIPLHGHPWYAAYTGASGSIGGPPGGLVWATQGNTLSAAFTGTPNGAQGQQIGGSGGGDGHTHNIDMRVQTASVILASRN